MTSAGPQSHILKQLIFPDRYEPLVAALGPEVARLVVSPATDTLLVFQTLAEDIRARNQGMFVPMFAPTGTGKSTLANSLTIFYPSGFAPTVAFEDSTVTYDGLVSAVRLAHSRGPHNEGRVIPLLVDGRESNPPSQEELAFIKRFLREPSFGSRTVVLWPETSEELAGSMASEYVSIAGSAAIDLPAVISGPHRDEWQQIAVQTLELANQAANLDALGVNPRDYDPAESNTLGEFLRKISVAFTKTRVTMLNSTKRPIRLSIVFCSESSDAGVLSQLTNSAKYGLVDGSALMSATKDSVIGRYWASHRGLLTQLIVQLDIRAFSLPPQVSVPSLRRFGGDSTRIDLEHLGISDRLDRINTAWKRTDLGKYLNGTARETFESRGTPSTSSTTAFQLLSEKGFTGGKDKNLNKGMLDALTAFVAKEGLVVANQLAETKLDFCPLVPDNSFVLNGDQHCIEYTWRAGEFLAAKRKADAASYILTKIHNYGRELNQV